MRREVPPPPEVVDALFRSPSVCERLVLVGGQALAVWMQRLGVAARGTAAAVTRDVDFLTTSPTDKDAVRLFADVILVRYYMPEGTDFAAVSDERLQEIERTINSRPRETLSWRPPLTRP